MVAILAAGGFMVALAAAFLLGRLPVLVLWLYGGASLIAVVIYTIDKRAAIGGRRRIRERTLHALALAGGWPGALAAQSVLRHKTAKHAFRRIFWLTMLLNCAALAGYLKMTNKG